MLTEGLAALAAAGGTAVVTAMVTDGWQSAKSGLARLFRHDGPGHRHAIEEQLERTRAELVRLSGTEHEHEHERARAHEEAIWQARLADLLDRSPQLQHELREWIDQMPPPSTGPVVQHVTGHDNAQQATLGTGVQHITFGDRPRG